ncbi:hypothetical protein F3Y22_tig00002840pilonHSYRG00794 [Hibiscus syriacus]|uniref:RNase H type-1 domain-containing protein n=1 Tax=Hibiscus syriacus TaxID=106335 RepID=A0A6A3CQ06_HIBSY|nr:hypothetical protein F3Y22_tig00002840pilonHSYRG00794 [Hibiscus syriacus]
MAAAGGVLRDGQGKWVFGFARSIGICSPLMAEMWDIHDSLCFAWNLGFRKIEVESDCVSAVEILNNNTQIMMCDSIVRLIKDLLPREWEVSIKHTHREANMVADRLAALARGEAS